MRPLSTAARRALTEAATAGGHGYGEHAYLGRRTALSLAARGLVCLGTRRFGGRWIPWCVVTAEGLCALGLDAEHAIARAAELRRLAVSIGFEPLP